MKCLNCFNECRDGLFFCNICGSPLYSGDIANNNASKNAVESFATANNAAQTSQKNVPVNENASADEVKLDNTDIKMPVIPKMPDQNKYAPVDSAHSFIDSMDASSEPVIKKQKYSPVIENQKQTEESTDELMFEKKDKQAKILTRGQFVAMELLLYVPIINIILLILWSVNKKGNPNRRNYAVAKLICIPLLAVFFIILIVFMYATGILDSIITSLESYLV